MNISQGSIDELETICYSICKGARHPNVAFLRYEELVEGPAMAGTILSRNSTTVTLAPSLAQTDPISKPMYPPPMTMRDFGTSLSTRAPVEETILQEYKLECFRYIY